MKAKNKKPVFKIAAGLILVFVTITVSFSQTVTASSMVREDVFSAKTPEQFKSAYLFSKNKTEKIAALTAIPMAIKKFNANTQEPTIALWLSAILNDALNSADLDVAQCAVEQIGNANILSFSDALIYMYGQSTATPQDKDVVVLRMKIIGALGSLGTPAAAALLGRVVDSHLVRPETDEALRAIGKMCATDLVPQINSYVKDLVSKINNNEFVPDDPAKKPMVSPDGSLRIALSTIQMLSSETCGKQ